MKHLRHPLRTASTVGKLASLYVEIKRFSDNSRHHFRDDPRYDLANVTDGLAHRLNNSGDDTELLRRICAAYNKAAQREDSAPVACRPTGWWQQIRQTSLGPVIEALRTSDIEALGSMYRNFFRDSCADGLIAAPYGLSKAYLGSKMNRMHRRFCLGDALYVIDYWAKQTGSSISLRDLAGPEIGNPFGILLEGTLVRTGAPYQHYSAHKILSYLDHGAGTVTEIGGGFGGMAYYLLRDHPGLKYLDFDLPESIALTSYYLMKAFPNLNFLLYGEKDLTPAEIACTDVVLMPLFEMGKVPSGSIDLVFSSHAVSDVSPEAMNDSLKMIARMTGKYFLNIGQRNAARSISEAASSRGLFCLVETRTSEWHKHRFPDVEEVECLYRASEHKYPAPSNAGSDVETACR